MNPQNSQQALAQLQEYQNNARRPGDILSEQQQRYGVSDAEGQVKGLRGAISSTTKLLQQVAPSVMGRTASSLVTSAQANKQIQNEQAPIAQNLSQQTQDYGLASEDYNRALQKATEGTNLEYGAQQNQLSFLQNLYNNLFAREAADEEKRRFEENLKLEREKLTAAERQAAAARSSSGGGGNYFTPPGGNRTADTGKKYIGNDDLRGRWAYEASRGDKDAKIALKYADNEARYDGPVANQAELQVLKRLGIAGNYYVRTSSGGGGW